MIRTYTHNDLIWHDLESPTKDEIRRLMQTYYLESIVAEELFTPTVKPRVDVYDNYIYLILHFPFLEKNSEMISQEVDFVIGRNFLITTHYNKIDPKHVSGHIFDQIFKPESVVEKKNIKDQAGYVFFNMILALYHSLVNELDHVNKALVRAEKNIFNGDEKKMLIDLSYINRDLLDFKEATNLHKSVLESFYAAGKKFFGPSFDYNLDSIMNEYYKVHTAISDSKDFLEELRRTNDSLLSNKQNEIMKTFTVLAFIFLPLSLIASIFGMNTDNIPLVTLPHSFAIITVGMALIGFLLFIIVKYKKWL